MATNKPYRISIRELDYFERVFSFIHNETLRTNLSIAFQYAAFLAKVETDFHTTGAVEYSIFKNIVQYTASIVEGVMHYGLEQLIKSGKVSEEKVMPKLEKYLDVKSIHKIDKQTEIIGVKRVISHEKYNKRMQFMTIWRGYKKGKLMDETLLVEVDNLREKRNKIHLAGLTQIENYYTKNDINDAFKTATKVVKTVAKLLS